MKIQGVNNNQKNISYRAYFKQNKALNTLYKNAIKTDLVAQKAKDFKNNLPNHEIELELEYLQPIGFYLCDLINNQTSRESCCIFTDIKNGLLKILDHCIARKETSFFEKIPPKTEIDFFDDLIKKD